ncbi:hypothetical protein [Dyadobacter frigoris]|uniref:Outer membrane protein beta-barrel domain-containing protein n=1 Tax=Dyadobacter frigoris TaxID=2576211 RepID=A0A4U6D8Q1_9BACT|nr:hypothetical protein [Dyadobacter frigoris]TKT93872.1 hypothetical protein FDK13_01270 [Dyadobacter frigoris]
MIRKFLQLFILISIYFPVKAQHRNSWKEAYENYKRGNSRQKIISPYSVTIRGGLTQFYGELGQQDMPGMFGIEANRTINKTLSMSLGYSMGKLGGQEVSFFNSYFINEYNAIELLAKWNLTEQFVSGYDGEFNINVHGGLGLMMFSANAFDIKTNNLLRFTNSKTSARNPLFLRWGKPHGKWGIKKTNERIIPVGVSFDYKLFEKLIFGFNYHFYFVRSDKVDATSGMRLINPEEADSYSKTPNDKFSFLALSVTYKFSGNAKRRRR